MRARLLILSLVAIVSACSIHRASSSDNNAATLPAIVFVGAPIFDEKVDGGDGVYQGSYHWRDGYVYARSATYHRGERTMGPMRPGRNLFAYLPTPPDGEWKLHQLTFLKTGAVFKPEPSFDGRKVLFSMRRDGEDWFNLYEVNVDGSGLKQLTDGPFNDFAGVYLPDGRIVFCSDRTGYLEEYHEERTECLFVMNADGTGIHQITFNPGTYFEPSVMKDGRILFSFWDAFHIDVPPLDKHETYLMTVNPDGSDERHLFGAGQYQFFNRQRHGSLGLTQARELPDGRILCQSEMGPSLIDLSRGTSIADALWPIFPGTTSVQLGGTGHNVHLSPLGTRSTAYPLRDGHILYSATPPGARDSAIWIAHPGTREEQLLIDIPNYAEFDAVPVLVEREKPRRLPISVQKPECYRSGLPLSPPRGRVVGGEGVEPLTTSPSPKRGEGASDTARFLIVAGRESDNPQRAEALKQARYFRVIEAEYTGVTTSSHTNLESRILGVVPIFPDGSAYFEAPADTPLFLDALDAAGNRVLHAWPFKNTSVPEGSHYPLTQMAYMTGRAGETKSCYGCHAPQTSAVPNTTVEAVKHPPVKITRELTDLQYRRNEPENYRRQARLGEEARAREWLKSKDPWVRARGCELLAAGDATTTEDAASLGKLLVDESVEVRRSAATALTRAGAVKQINVLENALKDADWQVRFSARCALEAIGRSAPPEGLTTSEFEWYGRRYKFHYERNTLAELTKPLPDLSSLRSAGRLKLARAVPLLIPWLKRHEHEYHAAEAAVALGRIATPEAVEALWAALRSEVANKQVVYARYLQHGPRPEEYSILKGLVLANAKPNLEDVHLLIAMLPNTFMEKPRFEDRMRDESQRVLLPRLLLEHAGFRKSLVKLLNSHLPASVDREKAALGSASAKDVGQVVALGEQVLKGINLERPFSEHGRPFPVVKQIGPEEALWLLTCLAVRGEVPEDSIVPSLTSKHHRERIDAAALLAQQGFGPKAAEALTAEAVKPYTFPEIWSIGKGMPDENFRDKAYMIMALAMHVDDVGMLKRFASSSPLPPWGRGAGGEGVYRDIRYGLIRGLARRQHADGIPLLVELATHDPLTLIRQQARYALSDIHDASRLRGDAVPVVRLPEPRPLEELYPPRGITWSKEQKREASAWLTDHQARNLRQWGQDKRDVLPHPKVASPLFRNLNMAQVSGAGQLMVDRVPQLTEDFDNRRPLPEQLMGLLDSPAPFVQRLAARTLARHNSPETIPALTAKLDPFAKSGNTVGFWWCCEALALLKAKDALPVLVRHAAATNPPPTHGPPGMAMGYIASKALAQIVADARHSEVERLLKSDNVWLRAGALRGLAEAKVAGAELMLKEAASPTNPAVVRAEAEVWLRRLEKD
jgi:HEAT repeat protein